MPLKLKTKPKPKPRKIGLLALLGLLIASPALATDMYARAQCQEARGNNFHADIWIDTWNESGYAGGASLFCGGWETNSRYQNLSGDRIVKSRVYVTIWQGGQRRDCNRSFSGNPLWGGRVNCAFPGGKGAVYVGVQFGF